MKCLDSHQKGEPYEQDTKYGRLERAASTSPPPIMPSAFDQLKDTPKKVKTLRSAFDSESFDADGTIHVDGLVGSATISPSGRDVALAS